MKPSRYNHRTTLPDGTVLLFNFYTLNLVELSPAQAVVAGRLLQAPPARPCGGLHKLLVEKGFLIGDPVDEREYLRHFHYQARTRPGNLTLTILPSLTCNFRCVYCYETRDHGTMTREVVDAVIRLADAGTPEQGTLSVTWFGGEPLLQMQIIERLSRAFIALCDRRGAEYAASIITNGYLLTGETARRLAGLKVNRAQVTLDGPAGIHDARRPTVSGKKTFERILANLGPASESLPISLRINVDHRNREHVVEVLDLLTERGLQGRVHPYLGHTLPYNEVCGDVAGYCMSDADFSLFELEFQIELIKRGFSAFHVPQGINTHCMAERPNAFVITPGGGIAKCWNDAANPAAEVAHLLRPQSARMAANAAAWNARDPFAEACGECKLLPICMGGCPHIHRTSGRVHCHAWKAHLDESLAAYHLVRRMEREVQLGTAFRQLVSGVEEAMAGRVSGHLCNGRFHHDRKRV